MDQDSSQRFIRSDPPSESVPDDAICDGHATSADAARRSLLVVHDSPQPCPYLDGRLARMPLEYPRRPLSPSDLDRLLAIGYRRTGDLFYRTRCPGCQSCVPVRVNVSRFRMTKSMKRILNRGRRELRIETDLPVADSNRLRLFNAHRAERELSQRGPSNLYDYRDFLVKSLVSTEEIAFYRDGELIGAAIVDLGRTALNAVYTYFDPRFGRYSIGTLAILLQMQWAIRSQRTHVYLGLFVAENRHLNYKDRFRPQQRLIDGRWQEVDAD